MKEIRRSGIPVKEVIEQLNILYETDVKLVGMYQNGRSNQLGQPVINNTITVKVLNMIQTWRSLCSGMDVVYSLGSHREQSMHRWGFFDLPSDTPLRGDFWDYIIGRICELCWQHKFRYTGRSRRSSERARDQSIVSPLRISGRGRRKMSMSL